MENKPVGVWKSVSTDYDNHTFDTGRFLVVLVVIAMIFLQGWDVIAHAAKFDAQSFGTGIGALLLGLGAYIFGDNTKRPEGPPKNFRQLQLDLGSGTSPPPEAPGASASKRWVPQANQSAPQSNQSQEQNG